LSSVNNKKLEIMIDTHDDHNPSAPWNQEETNPELTEVEKMQLKIDNLKDRIKRDNQRLNYKIWQLKKLASFEESIRTFGYLTFEETTEKNEILNQYLK